MDGVCIAVMVFFFFFLFLEKFVWLVQITTPFDNKDLFLEGDEEDKEKKMQKRGEKHSMTIY